jgi:acetylornithine deacetylase/succinyl-diaminopimelate desuccinylase-like protein
MNQGKDTDKRMQLFYRYVEDHMDVFIRELQVLLREMSIYTNTFGISSTANFLESHLQRIGCKVQRVVIDESKPFLYGEVGEGPVTVLFYNHYDVQPVDPPSQWDYGPFLAEIHEGYLYARGAADSKGNLYTRLAAVESYLKVFKELPCRVKFLFDGEEEVGSPNIGRLIQEHPDFVEADICVWESGFVDQEGRPSVSFGLKGLVYLELRCQNLPSDIHSAWATVIENPAWRLTHALASLRDNQGRITVDGLMDHVAAPSREERHLLASMGMDLETYKELYGVKEFMTPGKGESVQQRLLYSPTCNICGIHAGYTDAESKTILPHAAWANLDFRLVPELEPEMLVKLLRDHLAKRGFHDVEIKVKCAIPCYRYKPDGEFIDRIRQSSQETFHASPLFLSMLGSSGPMHVVCAPRRLPVMAFGIAHPGSHIHAPNENIRIHDLIQGIKFIGRMIDLLAKRD